MNDSSYADKINRWQITVQNIEDAVPTIPGIDPPFNDLRQKVADLRAAHDNAQMLRGKLREVVVLRRQLDRETRRSARRLAAVARGHLGFNNPVLESVNTVGRSGGQGVRTPSFPDSALTYHRSKMKVTYAI